MVPTGKSISVSVAVALRACEAVCGRVRQEASSGAWAKNKNLCGVPGRPAGPAAPPCPAIENTYKKIRFFGT